jgi:phage terminase large subunit-like protein
MFEQQSRTTYDAGHLYQDLLDHLSGNSTGRPIRRGEDASHLETDWATWLTRLLPKYLSDKSGTLIPFGEHHTDFWNWVWALQLDQRPQPFVGIWPRGGGKSTSAELAGAMVGALRKRQYVLYICDTLERAEDHVQNVAGMLESREIARFYPHVSEPMVGKTGASKGWRRNRLRTASGFTVDALGMDVAARGAKLDEVRPDLMVVDDIDVESDGPAATKKKIRTLTTKFFPAGAPNNAVLFVQNLIHPESIASRLAGVASEPADFLKNRILSGPFPAVHDLEWEERDGQYVITSGRAIWAGMDLAKCEEYMNGWGISAFLSESQQEVEPPSGGMFDQINFARLRIHRKDVPDLQKIEVWCDPAVTDTDGSDSNGLIVVGKAASGHLYVLWSWESRSTPERTLSLAIQKALEYGATTIGVETNQGGDLWSSTYEMLMRELRTDGIAVSGQLVKPEPWQPLPKFREEKAGTSTGGKASRATPMLAAYQRSTIHHVEGTHAVLEKALRRFPETKPFDLVDAASWAFHSLTNGPKKMRVY